MWNTEYIVNIQDERQHLYFKGKCRVGIFLKLKGGIYYRQHATQHLFNFCRSNFKGGEPAAE